MKKVKITNKDLKIIGITHPDTLVAISREANVLIKKRIADKAQLINLIEKIITNPLLEKDFSSEYKNLIKSIKENIEKNPKLPEQESEKIIVNLRENPLPYPIYGKDYIESGALIQMKTAMSLPISKAGALMPDAHEGYGLPIGGVLATNENTIIPYAVGVDIACRMCMSVYPVGSEKISNIRIKLRDLLGKHTVFGVGSKNTNHLDPSVFDKPEWNATNFIKQHRDLAYSQLGTSGAGNHFVEWGELKVLKNVPEIGLNIGNYLALLSHSGSRGFGNEVANFYSKIAMQKVNLPKEARHLAWLDLESQEGEEYWIAMNLAGDYASANHYEIHSKISKDFDHKPIAKIENHHNFACKEKLSDGKNAVIHRKGATPAANGVIGIIPGSMTHPGYVIRGKGNVNSLNSASHGAGRSMSRSQALKTFNQNDLEEILLKQDVELLGGDIDEIPMAYKDIDKVMSLQSDLVEILAIFQPRIVRMADAERRRRR